MRTVRGGDVEKLNNEAVAILAEQAKRDEKHRVAKKRSEIFNMEAFGAPKKPKSNRYRLPDIEDLVKDLKEPSMRVISHLPELSSDQQRKLVDMDIKEAVDADKQDSKHVDSERNQ